MCRASVFQSIHIFYGQEWKSKLWKSHDHKLVNLAWHEEIFPVSVDLNKKRQIPAMTNISTDVFRQKQLHHQKMPLGSSLLNMPSKSSSLLIRSSSTLSSAHWWSVNSSASHSAWNHRPMSHDKQPKSPKRSSLSHRHYTTYFKCFICICRHGHGSSTHLFLHDPWLVSTWGEWITLQQYSE